MINVLDVVKSNVSTPRNRLAAPNSPSHILRVLESGRQLGVHQIGIQGAVRHVREDCHQQLLVVGGVCHDTESAGLGQASSSTSVGAEAEPEALEFEGLDTGASAGDGLGVGVASDDLANTWTNGVFFWCACRASINQSFAIIYTFNAPDIQRHRRADGHSGALFAFAFASSMPLLCRAFMINDSIQPMAVEYGL